MSCYHDDRERRASIEALLRAILLSGDITVTSIAMKVDILSTILSATREEIVTGKPTQKGGDWGDEELILCEALVSYLKGTDLQNEELDRARHVEG